MIATLQTYPRFSKKVVAMRQDVVFFAWALVVGAGAISLDAARTCAVENKLEIPKVGDKEDESWIGEFVVPRTADVRGFTLGPRDKKVFVADLDEPYYQVLEDKDGRVKIITRQRVEAWVDKSELLPSAEAVEVFGKMIEKEPKNARGYLGRASANEALNNDDEALTDLDNAIRLDARLKTAWNSRGNLYVNRKEYDKALHDFDEALKIAPKDAVTLNDRGVVYQTQKDFAKAQADYDAAISLEPKLLSAYANRGSAWLEQKDFDKALADYNSAIEIDGGVGYLYAGRGRAYSEKKEYLKARFDFEEAADLDPSVDHLNAVAWLLSTCPDNQIRNPRKALRFAERAVRLSETDDTTAPGDILDTLAAAYASVGKFKDATRTQEEALEDPDFVETHGDEGRQRLELYRDKKAYVEK
ncbi:MAG TPA: tetratricopeptide repeat protein [Gemmataceae bacterium]|nr:tetratricopeptide repeat protein [Gemmataceae bacterium]